MKKALLGTSALVGAGLLAFSPAPASANDLELSISGSAAFAVYSIDGDDYNSNAGKLHTRAQAGLTPTEHYAWCVGENAAEDPVIVLSDGFAGATGPAMAAANCLTAGKAGEDGAAVAPFQATAATAPAQTISVASVGPAEKVESNDLGITRGSNRLVFDTKGTMDNGLTVGSRVRLEARSGVDDPVDEHYAWIQGGFGQFQIGAKNAAGYQMHYASPGLANNAVDSPLFVNRNRSASAGTATYVNLTEDAYKINYFTPRFNGLQLGASFVPNGGDAGKSGSAVYDARTVDLQDVYSLGANYVNDFGDVGVAVSGGYATGTARDKDAEGDPRECEYGGTGIITAVAPATNAVVVNTKCEDPAEWSVGTQLSMSGFTVGGAYKVRDNISGVDGQEGNTWSAGVTYAKDLWSVGVGYLQGTVERDPKIVTRAGTTDTPVNVNWADAETTFLLLGANYKLGPGVNLGAEVQIIEDENPLATASGTFVEASGSQGSAEVVKTNSVGLTLGLSF